MTDLELTKLCAEAMGYKFYSGTAIVTLLHHAGNGEEYDPLHDDAQAMALVKKLHLWLDWSDRAQVWNVSDVANEPPPGESADLNRAICECVYKMVESKKVTEIK